MKRINCILLSLFLLFSSAGCGKQVDPTDIPTDSGSESLVIPEEFFYKQEQLAEVEMDCVLDFSLTGKGLTLTGYSERNSLNEHGIEEWGVNVRSVCFALDGSIASDITLIVPKSNINEWGPSSAAIDEAGNTWLLYNTFEDGGITFSLESYIPDGSYQKSLELDLTDVYVQDFAVTGNSGSEILYIYAIHTDNLELGFLRAYDGEGAQLFEVENIKGMCVIPDGQVIVKRTSESRITFREVDPKGNLGEEAVFTADTSTPGTGAYYNVGSGYFEMIESDHEAVYGYRFDEGTRTRLIEWPDQGINHSGLDMYRHIAMVGDDLYCLLGTAGSGNTPEKKVSLIRLARTDEPPDVTDEKKVIILAALYGSSFVVDTVARFNADSQEYKIQMKTYNFDNDAFILDLIAGNVPDMYVFPSTLGDAIGTYAGKGLFTDLYEFIDADPDISRDDFVGSVLKALEIDGKLYGIAPWFRVDTVVGRASDVGTGTGWTWDDFNALMAGKPAGTIPMATDYRPMSGMNVFGDVLVQRTAEFVDFNAGICYFDTPTFINLMEAIKAYYPMENNYTATADDFMKGDPLIMQSGCTVSVL